MRDPLSEEALKEFLGDQSLAQIASILSIQSEQNRAILQDQILFIARWYDIGLLGGKSRRPNREIVAALKKVRKQVVSLQTILTKTVGEARSEVGYAPSKTRPARVLRSGEPVLPYGHPHSTEWLFDRENLQSFMQELSSIEVQLVLRCEELGRGGRPRGPEAEAVKGLQHLYKQWRGTKPRPLVLQKLSELVLQPVARLHGRNPNFEAFAKEAL